MVRILSIIFATSILTLVLMLAYAVILQIYKDFNHK